MSATHDNSFLHGRVRAAAFVAVRAGQARTAEAGIRSWRSSGRGTAAIVARVGYTKGDEIALL
jgi:hypothetical protein